LWVHTNPQCKRRGNVSLLDLANVTAQIGNGSCDAPHSVITPARQPTTLQLMAEQCLCFI
jgi:hypothetical protein